MKATIAFYLIYYNFYDLQVETAYYASRVGSIGDVQAQPVQVAHRVFINPVQGNTTPCTAGQQGTHRAPTGHPQG